MKKILKGMDGWLEEQVMCGWSFPITRRRAMNEMMADGMSQADAIKALCWFKAVR